MKTKIHHTFRLLGMAVLGLLTVTACSNDDNTSGDDSSIGVPVQSRGIPFSATISAAGAGSRTRALSGPDATTNVITATWAVNETVAMVYKVGSETKVTKATVSDVSDGTDGKAAGTATITATLDGGVTTGTPVTLVYPYSAVETSGDNIGQVKSDVFAHQDGTIAGISTSCDLRQATGTITLATSPASLSSNVKMASQIAIWKLSLKKDASTALAATKLDIYFGGKTASAASASTPASTLFMAVPAGTTGLTIIASDGTDSYIYNKASVTLAASTYYQSEVTLAKQTTHSITTGTKALELTDGDVVTGTGGGDTQLKIAPDATVTLFNLTNTSISNTYETSFPGIECLGNATIILEGVNSVKGVWGKAGIYVPEGKTLTIRGGGKLTATANDGAGIGSGYASTCGNIVIEGGNITATGSDEAAGIGSGQEGSCGTITITGGNITATGDGCGAGIGSGYEGSCGTITITGGTINATGGAYAAGIGSGEDGSCNAITITGGTINAKGGAWAAGIGSGHAIGATNTCGDISISGSAQVTATGGKYAAGIGSGNGNGNSGNPIVSSCGDISIAGGTIEATGGDRAAGIGSGECGKFASISITSGITRVTATSGSQYYAPIGKGEEYNLSLSGDVTIDDVTIDGGYDYSPYEYTPSATTNLNWTLSGNTWTLTPSN